MILLFNVLLTDERINNDVLRQQRGFLDYPFRPYQYDKVDIFKYTLASYSVIPFSKVIVNCALDAQYQNRKEELRAFIAKEFEGSNLKLSFNRIEYQSGWQKLYEEELDNDLIWFSCNHDHIFMDYNLDVLLEGIKLLSYPSFACGNNPASIYPSHYPELLRKASHIHNENPCPPEIYDKYIGFRLLNNNDSFQIINKALYRRWWLEENYGDAYLPRSDYRLYKDDQAIGYDIRQNRKTGMLHHYCFVPLRELCRHYDGYGYIGINSNRCPALLIPPGFFENNIKIRYGYEDYQSGWVNICPGKLYYSVLDQNGTDYKWVLDDIPLFWQNRISEIVGWDESYIDKPDYQYDYDWRNNAVYDIANAGMVAFTEITKQEWFPQWQKLNRKEYNE